MEELGRYNAILTSVYAQDNAYRALTYLTLLVALHRPAGSQPTELDKSLADLRAKIGDARMLNRLFVGTTASVQGFLAGGWSSTEDVLSRIMSLSMVLYHPLEHAYLQSTFKPPMFPSWDGGWASKWSCRMWLVYVLCDLTGTLRQLSAVNKSLASGAHGGKTAKLERDRRNLLIWLTCIAADFPLALQWSVDVGPFGDRTIAWAGFYGGVAGLYLRWLRATEAAREAKEKAQ